MVKSQLVGRSAATRSEPRLYVIPGSHACRAAMLMLERKGFGWRPFEFMPGVQTIALRPLGFPGRTVPAIKFDGVRVQGNRHIARWLDRLEPEPALLPRHRRSAIEDAERFADEVLQTVARRLVLAAGGRDLGELAGDGDSGRLGAILARRPGRRRRIMRLAGRHFGISDRTEALDLAALPKVLDHVDSLVAAGTLDGPEPNAADFQIAPSLCLLAYRLDLRDEVESRPSWCVADRLLPAPVEAG
jgi:glutathione S-transferase